MPDEGRTMTSYAPAQLDRIMDVFARASGERKLESAMVEQELLELMHAVGLACDGAEASLIWHELDAEEPSPKAERDGFLRLARAEDPFKLARRSGKLLALLRGSPGLRQARACLRNAGYPLSSIEKVDWGKLSGAEQATVRRALEDAATYAGHFARPGRAAKTKLDTALLDLAGLFVSWTGKPIARHRVPYSVNSQFIEFAVAALEPVGKYFEVSYPALSRRWERIVLAARKEKHELDGSVLDQGSEPKS